MSTSYAPAGAALTRSIMLRYDLEVAARSHLGRVRTFNEDSFAAEPGRGFVGLADGMATAKGADVAAKLATQTLVSQLATAHHIAPRAAAHAAFAAANRAIRDRARADPALAGMGTTLSAAWFRGDRVCVAHVGDSRVYRWRAGRLERLTTDHSFVQAQLTAGQMTADEARASKSRHLVTRVLGAEEQVAPDLGEHEVLASDVFLLCTDGLHDLVEDADIANALEVLEPNLELAASTLVAMANDRGGRDNISVILVRARSRVGDEPQRKTPDQHGLLGWLRSKVGGEGR
jgi:serine/threonine protein phosphatase PrpC